MSLSTASGRAYIRWCCENHPNALRAIRDMDPRLRELLAEELAKEAGPEDKAEYVKVRTSVAADHFDVTQKTIRKWRYAENAPKRIKPSDCRGYVLVHPDDWLT